ncbi:hypothetical protein [Streptomyces tropicalis]|uniref:Uncharacterized protein n=1 Tax=Streptomyces tropicalis TaxID=3034234 RepID=A0ABT6A978_9ACTN|nr:hypothetical protein [Streptomyces tropicalis]MDF3301208.1 hypothetical protein [Streptomyces tropicalis]
MTDQLPPQPTAPPPPVEPPPPPATKGALSSRTAGLLGLAVGAGIVGAIWAITANVHSGPATFTLNGSFALTEDAGSDGSGGCEGTGGYDDISEGASVTVYGASGDVIATGHLGDSASVSYGTCNFDISVPGAPKGEKFYKVEVSHRGTVQLTAQEAENGALAASLG